MLSSARFIVHHCTWNTIQNETIVWNCEIRPSIACEALTSLICNHTVTEVYLSHSMIALGYTYKCTIHPSTFMLFATTWCAESQVRERVSWSIKIHCKSTHPFVLSPIVGRITSTNFLITILWSIVKNTLVYLVLPSSGETIFHSQTIFSRRTYSFMDTIVEEISIINMPKSQLRFCCSNIKLKGAVIIPSEIR